MLAENKMIVQLFEVRTLEIREVTFRASPLSTSKEKKKKGSDHVQHTKQPHYVHYTQCFINTYAECSLLHTGLTYV